jgi:thiosulfate sulfurtransferase
MVWLKTLTVDLNEQINPVSIKHIDVSGLKEMLAEGKVIIADIRDDLSYETAHIEGSIQLGDRNLQEFLADASESIPVVVVCYHGRSSQTVAGFLVEQGYTDVYSLDGGYTDWAAAQG